MVRSTAGDPLSRVVSATILIVIAGMYAFTFIAAPDLPVPGVSLCMMKSLTGIPCPLCGMTRAFVSISKGDFAGAVGLNALSPLFYAGGLLLGAAFAADYFRSRRFGVRSLGSPMAIVILGSSTLALYWIARVAWMEHTGALGPAFRLSPLGKLLFQN
jgi:hypothetical protein